MSQFPFNASIPERIETIVDCFMMHRTAKGLFGSIVDTDLGYSVQIENRLFTVWTDADGHWNVREGDAFASARTLLDAASMLIGADFVRRPHGVC